jgi:hypothetical protein
MAGDAIPHELPICNFPSSNSCADRSATWADGGQTIKPHIILLDPPRQIVFPGVDLVSANSLVLAYLDWLMADDGLHVGVFLR